MKTKSVLTLKDYIRLSVTELGIDRIKNKFGVTESTINHWARGACLPRSEQMEKIVKLSDGRVSYAEMIETFNRIQALRKRAKARKASKN